MRLEYSRLVAAGVRGAAGKDVEVGDIRFLNDPLSRRLETGSLERSSSLKPFVVFEIKDVMLARFAKIGVNQQGLLIHLGDGDSEVADHGRFSFRRTGAGDHHDPRPTAVFAGEKDGDQGGAEGLGHDGRFALPGNEFHAAASYEFANGRQLVHFSPIRSHRGD
jgi:hypothetical protein